MLKKGCATELHCAGCMAVINVIYCLHHHQTGLVLHWCRSWVLSTGSRRLTLDALLDLSDIVVMTEVSNASEPAVVQPACPPYSFVWATNLLHVGCCLQFLIPPHLNGTEGKRNESMCTAVQSYSLGTCSHRMAWPAGCQQTLRSLLCSACHFIRLCHHRLGLNISLYVKVASAAK